jgi:hypothetical protein
MNKARLERLGFLPQSILVTDATIAWDGDNGGPENLEDEEESVV